jgi:8-oxo-dGTP diphosphatase
MKEISMVLLFDRAGRLLIYLRDDNSNIPFPNHWDFFGGHVEDGETPEQALVREVKEELGVELTDWNFFRIYVCTHGDAYPNVKYVYWAKVDAGPEELTLHEGQELKSIGVKDRKGIRFANILGGILEDFIAAGLWLHPVDSVDNFSR